jgi:hypothetical protein
VYAPTWSKERFALSPADASAIDEARTNVLAAGEAFRRAAGPAISAALRSNVEALVALEREWSSAMSNEVRSAFYDATERAIAQGAGEAVARLTDDVWLDPLIAPGMDGSAVPGWEVDLPEWLIEILRALSGKGRHDRLGDLDEVTNRAWVVVLAAAKPLDPVLEEFGLPPSDIPDLGGGNFGLAPKDADELDPSGALRSLWDRYRDAYERYRALAGRGGERR